tara:strand:+ start:1499 stop:2653 length:1155 start_codon:yes stop_codon:yes gene_type:complete
MEGIKMKAAVLGVGRMGAAICHALRELDFYVVGIDSNPEATQKFREQVLPESGAVLYGPNGKFYLINSETSATSMESALLEEKPDIVISSLPYHQLEGPALFCIDNGIRYCDLGGRVDVSEKINSYAKENATKPVFTDLGLAPGWVNILAEQGCKEIHREIDSVQMMVGGLPTLPDNPPFNYSCTWSVDGLINEYRDDCEVLINGELKSVAGLEGLEEIHSKILAEDLEAFYTSGGASHSIKSMMERGVKNCSYKTLRYKGHCDAVKLLLRHSDLSEDCLNSVFENGCKYQKGDMVIIKAIIRSGDLTWDKELLVPFNLSFDAMQVATSSPITAVAKIMAEGKMEGDRDEHRDYYSQYPKNLSYKDVPFDEFDEVIKKLIPPLA